MAQLLRMPMTISNLIALAITQSVYRSRKALLASDPNTKPCAARINGVFGILTLLFAASVFHNLMSVMRFHRIRREVFGESMCAARRRWRQQGEIILDEEERKARMEKFKQMSKKMPSLPIALGDITLAVGFLGMWLMTTLIAKREGKVELGVAYASIGALVACVLNIIVGMSGVKVWARKQKSEREDRLESATEVSDVKEKLLN